MATITQKQTYEVLALAVVAREHELHGYQINIDNYTHMLEALPKGAWPVHLEAYRGITENTVADVVPPALHEQVSDLLYRDKIQRLLVTERMEQRKSRFVYDALVAQLPVDTAQSLVAQAATDMAARVG